MLKYLNTIKTTYIIIFLSLATWAFFGYYFIYEEIKQQGVYAKIINLSGKQRMLSQKTALMVKRIADNQDPQLISHLEDLISQMQSDHKFLVQNLTSINIEKVYFEQPLALDQEVNHYIQLLKQYLETQDRSLIQSIEQTSFGLLPKLNNAVTLYEQESQVRTKKLEEKEKFILYGTLIALTALSIIFILIFNRIKKSETLFDKHQKEIEERLEKEAQLQSITQASQDAIIQMDADGNISFWNPAAERILGYKAQEVLGQNLHQLLTPERFMEAHNKAFPHFVKHGTGNAIGRTIELAAIHKEGHEIIIALSLSAVKQNNQWHAVGVMRDITQEKEKENQLIEQTEALKRSQETLSENVLYSKTDWRGIITEASEVFCKLSGYSKEELIGKSHNIVRHPDMPKSHYKELWATLKNGQTWHGEFKNRRKDGGYYWVDAIISPEYDKDGNFIGYLSIRHDITAKKSFEEQQTLMYEQSKLASMGEMMANIAHQWRQPLSAISICASGIRVGKEFGTLTDEKTDEFIQSIMDNTQYLSNTINTFRDFLRGKSEKVTISVCDLVGQGIALVKDTIVNNQIKLINNIIRRDDQEEILLHIPIHEFSQVIINILNNAKDVIKERSIEDAWVQLDAIKEDDKVIITIEDNAGGIPDEVLPKIFDPYFTTKHQSQGTGLGLHMSYKIITESIQGKLYAKNTSNGAKFYIEIPLTNS